MFEEMQYQLFSLSALLSSWSLSSSSLSSLLLLLTIVEVSKIDLEGKLRLSYDYKNIVNDDYHDDNDSNNINNEDDDKNSDDNDYH